jgi:hypothetical protein
MRKREREKQILKGALAASEWNRNRVSFLASRSKL